MEAEQPSLEPAPLGAGGIPSGLVNTCHSEVRPCLSCFFLQIKQFHVPMGAVKSICAKSKGERSPVPPVLPRMKSQAASDVAEVAFHNLEASFLTFLELRFFLVI